MSEKINKNSFKELCRYRLRKNILNYVDLAHFDMF